MKRGIVLTLFILLSFSTFAMLPPECYDVNSTPFKEHFNNYLVNSVFNEWEIIIKEMPDCYFATPKGAVIKFDADAEFKTPQYLSKYNISYLIVERFIYNPYNISEGLQNEKYLEGVYSNFEERIKNFENDPTVEVFLSYMDLDVLESIFSEGKFQLYDNRYYAPSNTLTFNSIKETYYDYESEVIELNKLKYLTLAS
ncbi:hypothetical protein ACFLZN_00455, partial [Nanoarchaeota archaeon]